MSLDLVVTGVGAVTPVGLSAPATCAALRAGIPRLIGFEDYEVPGHDSPSTPLAAGRVPIEWFTGGPVEEEWPGHVRFGAPIPLPLHLRVPSGPVRLSTLAEHAVREACEDAGLGMRRDERLGLYLGTDEADDSEALGASCRRAMPIEPDVIRTYPHGRAAGLVALAGAARDLSDGAVTLALVGGVDSLIRRDVLIRLDAARRLRSASAPDGFLPGEAAAFIVLEQTRNARARAVSAYADVRALATAVEPTAGTDRPVQGTGLTEAVRAVIDAADRRAGCLAVCDLNGERTRAIEWALVNARLSHEVRWFSDLWHAADCIGDTGAASGILSTVWASTALHKGYAGSPHVLIWGASDGRARAAAWLEQRSVT